MSLNFKRTHLRKNNAISIESIEFKPRIKSIDKNLLIKDIINQKTGEFLVCKPVSPYPKPFHVSKKLYLKLSAIFKWYKKSTFAPPRESSFNKYPIKIVKYEIKNIR